MPGFFHNSFRCALGCLGLLLCLGTAAADDEALLAGKQIFERQCADCHGSEGQGVAGAADEALYGNRSLDELTKIINDTMPDGEPESCVGDDARRVASYIYSTFYTAEARAKARPPRVELLRMTVPQYRNSVADLLASFTGRGEIGGEQGLAAEYYNERRSRRDKLVLERVDSRIVFDYGEKAPLEEKVGDEEFFIRWKGSLVAEESGSYEIVVRTGNGMRLWLNNDDEALLDAWVSSGGTVLEHRVTVDLLGGRAYPLRIEFFKHRDKTASIELRWKPPHKAEEVIPPRHLRTSDAPASFVVATPFPPDDRSVGYERGSAVSQAWDEATTHAAVETAEFVVNHVDRLAGTRSDDKNRLERWREFCQRFAERAFRRPLSDEQKKFFIDNHFEAAENPETALKRVILLVLKSPRFLYLGIDEGESPDFAVAARLSFGLWDSLPDEPLREAAARGELRTEEQVAQQAERMLADPRTRAKLRTFFHHWLQFDHAEDLRKDDSAYPGFDEHLIADLRTSIEMFVDSVVWDEQSDFRQLLLAETMFVNRRLAEFYDVEADDSETPMADDVFQPVRLDADQRAGVITHPYMLAALAYHESTSPIHRGVFLTRKVMNRALNPPPMAIDFNDARFDPHLTMREKVTELTKESACQSCHSIINPLGFSLEHYDAVGRYRTSEKDKPIDAASQYVTPEGESFTLTGARDVAQFAANSERSQIGFVEDLFHHLVKQPAAAYGDETLAKLRNDFAGAEFSMRRLIVDIMKQTALRGVDPS